MTRRGIEFGYVVETQREALDTGLHHRPQFRDHVVGRGVRAGGEAHRNVHSSLTAGQFTEFTDLLGCEWLAPGVAVPWSGFGCPDVPIASVRGEEIGGGQAIGGRPRRTVEAFDDPRDQRHGLTRPG